MMPKAGRAPHFAGNLQLNGGGQGSKQPWNHRFQTREVSGFEEARQVLLQALDQIISPNLSELLGEAEGEGEEGLWSPQSTRGSGEQGVSPRTGSDRRSGELCPWLLLRAMLWFSVFFPTNLLTCSLTLQSWEPFVNYFLLWFPWKTESHMHHLPRDDRNASGLTTPLPLTNEAKEEKPSRCKPGISSPSARVPQTLSILE